MNEVLAQIFIKASGNKGWSHITRNVFANFVTKSDECCGDISTFDLSDSLEKHQGLTEGCVCFSGVSFGG